MLDFIQKILKKKKRKKILVIDDEPNILKTVTTVLEQNGYIVYSAISGQDGINQAKIMRPDLILLDVIMPPPDGIEVYKELKKSMQTKEIPVLFATAKAEKQIEYLGVSDPFLYRHHIKKPFSIETLLKRIESILSVDA